MTFKEGPPNPKHKLHEEVKDFVMHARLNFRHGWECSSFLFIADIYCTIQHLIRNGRIKLQNLRSEINEYSK